MNPGGNLRPLRGVDRLADVLDRYRELASRVDAGVSHLVGAHRSRMKCAAGCAACCTRISVLPVEWYIVRAVIGADAMTDLNEKSNSPPRALVSHPPPNPCGFLRDGVCSIYRDRPLVCRVHGLPLRYRVVSYDETGVVSDDAFTTVWCDLNFTGQDPNRPTFTDGECFDMNALNTELDALNAAFLRTAAGHRFAGKHGVFLCDGSA